MKDGYTDAESLIKALQESERKRLEATAETIKILLVGSGQKISC